MPNLQSVHRRCCFFVLIFFPFVSLYVLLANTQVVWSDPEKVIVDRLEGLIKLDDNVRARRTEDVGLQIRALPAVPNKLRLAVALSRLATEGDVGYDTLQEVTFTLEMAIREQSAREKSDELNQAYDELASLVRHEHMRSTLNDQQFTAALSRLEANDAKRQNADFTLADLHGKNWNLRQLTGKVVLVNFWATWCPPCREEMPDLQALYDEYKDQGLVVLSISDEKAAEVSPFIAEQKISYPVLLDPGDKVRKQFTVEGIPETFVYDRTGRLVAQAIDMRTRSQFQRMLAQAGLQ
jgi:peroxiredoxin